MWIIELSVAGLSCWAGPIICVAYAYNENKTNENVVHIETLSVPKIDQTNTFQANISLRSQAIAKISTKLPKQAEVKYVESGGYLSFPCSYKVKTSETEPPRAYELAVSHHNEIITTYVKRFPDWGFAQHKGEGTAEHRRLILNHKSGTPVHRRSFMPLARFYSSVSSKKSDTGYVASKKKR